MASAKRVTLIVWFVGMGVLIGLTVWSGAGLVGHAIISTGWATALVILVRIVALAAAGHACGCCFRANGAVGSGLCAAAIRARGDQCAAAVAQIGGDSVTQIISSAFSSVSP
jgi:hypothetical protein